MMRTAWSKLFGKEAEVLSPRTTSAKCPEDADTDGTASPQQSSDLFNPAADKGKDAPPGLRIQCSASSRRDSADVSTESVLRKFGIRRPSDSAVKRISQQKQQEQQAQESPTAVVGSRCHEMSLSNSVGSDGDTEICSQESSEPQQPRRSSFGDAADPVPSWEIDTANLRMCEGSSAVLGSGSFGRVVKGVLNDTTDVALKMTIISPEAARRRSLCDRLEASFMQEIALLKILSDGDPEHLLQFYGVCLWEGQLTLVTELMKGGDLRVAIHNDSARKLAWYGQGRNIALDVAHGIAFLHDRKVIHRDIKSKNILLTEENRAKLADVGMAKMMTLGQHSSRQSVDFAMGTFAWAAPEMLMGEELTPAVDVYSLGVVLWEIVTQEMPSRGQRRDPKPNECPLEVAAIIHACLRRDPKARPTAADVVAMLEAAPTDRPEGLDENYPRSSISEASLRLHDGSAQSSVCFSTRSSCDVRNVQAYTDVEASLQRAMTNSLGSRDRSMIIGLESISEADSSAVPRPRGGVGHKQSRMCQSDNPQPIRVSAVRSVSGPKKDACNSTVLAVQTRKVRPRGNAAPAAAPGDLYSFAALPTVPSAKVTPDSAAESSMSEAAAELAAAKAQSRRNSLQSMQAAAEKNNPYAALASSLGGMQAAPVNGLADTFASAGARVGGKPMPSVRPAARAAVSGNFFAMADARVGGAAMPPRAAKAGGQPGPDDGKTGLEGREAKAEVTNTEQPAAGATATNPYAGMFDAMNAAPPPPLAATRAEDTAQMRNSFSALSAPLPFATVASDHKDDDVQPPPNPFASSSKRSEPQLEGWRVMSS